MIREFSFPIASVDELADHFLRTGRKVHKHDNIWWREIRPFFCMPLLWLTPITPEAARPNPTKSLCGYLHNVPVESPSNGKLTYFLLDDVSQYSIDTLKNSARRNTLKGINELVTCKVENLEDLLTDGYEVYLSWKKRIWKDKAVDLSNPNVFRKRLTNEFNFSKNLILGSYYNGRLVAFLIGFAVDQTAYFEKMYTHRDYHYLHPSEALTYYFIEACKQSGCITTVWDGFKSRRASLNDFKKRGGSKEVTFPTYIKLNPLVRLGMNIFLRKRYNWLRGSSS